MNFGIGDYNNKKTGDDFETIKTNVKKSVSKKFSEPKVSQFFQETFETAQTETSKKLINTQVEQYAENIKNDPLSLESKANSLGINYLKDQNNITNKSNIHHQLIHEDFQRMNSINDQINHSETNSFQFESMNNDELEEILDNPKTSEEEKEMILDELDKRMNQLEELESQKKQEMLEINEEESHINEEESHINEEESHINEEEFQETEKKSEKIEIKKSQEVKLEKESDKLNIDEFLIVDQNGKTWPATLDDIENKKLNFILLISKTGVVKIPQNMVKHFKEGQIIKDKNGQDVKITKIDVLSKEKVEQFRQSFILHFNNLNSSLKEEKKGQTNLDEIPLKNPSKERPYLEKNSKILTKQIKPKVFVDVNLNIEKKSIKEINEERFENLKKAEEILEEVIKKILLSHERLVQEKKSSDLSSDIKNMDEKSHELYTKSLDVIAQAQEIISDINKIKKETGIPLAHITRFIKIDRSFQKIIKFIPKESLGKDKDTYQALLGVISSQKEFMDFVQLSLSSNNGIKVTSSGNVGRTMGPV